MGEGEDSERESLRRRYSRAVSPEAAPALNIYTHLKPAGITTAPGNSLQMSATHPLLPLRQAFNTLLYGRDGPLVLGVELTKNPDLEVHWSLIFP